MSESPSVDEFIRHMQAELDACEDIVDKEERQKRQWQIESTLLMAIEFSVQALSMPDGANSEIAKQVMAIASGMCPSCGTSMESDLDFCSNCGNYVE
jgi:predicted nucleic acid-binding Zn ribbon protein